MRPAATAAVALLRHAPLLMPTRPTFSKRLASASSSGQGYHLSIFLHPLTRQHNRTVQRIRQSAMPTPYHHGAYDDFAERREQPAKRSVRCGMAQGEANVSAMDALAVTACLLSIYF